MNFWRPARVAALALLFVAVGQGRAASILYFSDLALGTDRMAEALAGRAGDAVTTATDLGDFATQIAGGGFDLGILFQQNSSGAAYDAAHAALGAFVAGGGLSIAADWTVDNTHAALYGAGFTGNVNDTAITVTHAALLPGIVNPITLTNPGWGVFSTGLNGGTAAALFGGGESAIVLGNSDRSILNGFLNDTFTVGAQGVQLFNNEIDFLLAVPQRVVPEPSSMALLGLGGLAILRRRRK